MIVNQGVKVSTENRKGAQSGERMRGLRENFALLFFLTVLTRTGETAQKHAFFRHKKTPIKGVCKFKWWRWRESKAFYFTNVFLL
jgi:hypothetical protein